MTVTGAAFVALLTALTILSLRSIAVLGQGSPWTSAGWWCTVGYDCAASYEIVAGRHLPLHAPYAFLAGLTVAFVVAGFRREAQAEPWWWPRSAAHRLQDFSAK